MKRNPIPSMDGSLDGVEFIYVLKWKRDLVTLLPLTQYAKDFIIFSSDSQFKILCNF
jgi:hypothetical protein